MAQQTTGEAAREAALSKAAQILKGADRVLILAHKSPDGDTMGSGFALCRALHALQKQARVICDDPFPQKYGYLFEGLSFSEFEPQLIVASDIASPELMGEGLKPYADKVSLCVDHHPSNTGYAAFTALDPKAAATCELMTDLICLLGVEIDANIANCLYTGLATDTGCFRYSSTSPRTLKTAALLMEKGAEARRINKRLFETVTRARLELERMALETLDYYFDGRVAVMALTCAMTEQTGVPEWDTEGIPSIPARIEGVSAGITLKEKKDGGFKISLRTDGMLNASRICARLGGGGHAAAAGCRVSGDLSAAKAAILKAVEAEIGGEPTGEGETGK